MAKQPSPEPMTLAEKQQIAESRCWEPWSDRGPLLRSDSYTARVLTFLTPRSAHLESRGEFIGEFPAHWVEENMGTWESAIKKSLLVTKDAGLDTQGLSRRNINHQRRILDLELANQIANDTTSSIQSDSSKRERLMREMRRRRRRFREDQLQAIEQRRKLDGTDVLTSSESLRSKSSGSTVFYDAESPPLGSSSSESSVSEPSTETEDFLDSQEVPVKLLENVRLSDRADNTDQDTNRSQDHTSDQPTTSNSSNESESTIAIPTENPKSISTAKSPTTSILKSSRDTPNTNTTAVTKPRAKSPPNSGSSRESTPPSEIGFAPRTSLRKSLVSSLKSHTPFRAKTPSASAEPHSHSTSASQAASIAPTNTSLAKKVRVLSPGDLHRNGIEPLNSIAQSLVSHSASLASKTNYWHHLPFTKVTKNGPKIYQGRFLVQERRTKRLEPNMGNTDDQTATTLVSRWKECAVLARRNKNVDQPLNLYFYRSSNMEKLTKRKDKTHGLEHKVKLSRGYRIALFSPLDLSLAIWKPRKLRRRKLRHRIRPRVHRNLKDYFRARKKVKKGAKHEHHTRILVINAQSMTAILDLAYLLAAATGSAPTLYGRSQFSVEVPSINVNVQIEAQREIHHDPRALKRALTSGLDKLVPYRELLKPAVTASSAAKPVLDQTWKLIEQLPRRFNAGRCKGNDKFALAWVLSDADCRPLWVPSALTTMFPMNRLRFLVNDRAQLVLAQPDPKCYVDTTFEPPFVEGYCSRFDAVFSRTTAKRLNSQAITYLFTSDHYLFITLGAHAKPPVLASAQNTIVKTVDPFPLTEDGGHIRWLQGSTCLAEVDRRDAMARCELERRKCLLAQSQGMISLLHFNSITVENDVWVEIKSSDHTSCFRIEFATPVLAQVWQEKLTSVAEYWRRKFEATALHRLAKVDAGSYGVTTHLRNRPIIYSGQLFMKTHRFATFKSHHVILTANEMVVFRIGTTLRAPAQPQQTIPASSVNHERLFNIELRDSYVYSGIAATHALLNNDVYNDPSNPGVLALPRSYDYGRITTDTEQDRCFVLWFPTKPWFGRFSKSAGRFYAFLAPEKASRDDWITAIKSAQDNLQLRSDVEDVDARLFLDEDNDD